MQISYTPQEAFDTVVNHLYTQKTRAINGDSYAYRGPNNTKCAIGALIPDELYDSAIEGKNITSLKFNRNLQYLFNSLDIIFLCSLQFLHDYADNWSSPNKLGAAAIKLAKGFNLDYTVVENHLNQVCDWPERYNVNKSEWKQIDITKFYKDKLHNPEVVMDTFWNNWINTEMVTYSNIKEMMLTKLEYIYPKVEYIYPKVGYVYTELKQPTVPKIEHTYSLDKLFDNVKQLPEFEPEPERELELV